MTIDPATHALGELVPPGMLIAAPFRTSITLGAVLGITMVALTLRAFAANATPWA